MATKTQELLTTYLGDMYALESHIFQAIDKQAALLDEHPDAQAKVRAFRTTLAAHLDPIKTRIEELGGSSSRPLKEGVAAALGVAAGLIDKVRSSEAAKDLRDDYTALNHSVIAYQMLYTTAVAAGDQKTADLAKRHLQDNATFVMEINTLMPKVVLDELREDGLAVDDNALSLANAMTREVWHQAAENGQ